MRAEQTNLALEGGGGVLVRSETIIRGLLQLRHQPVGVDHERVDQILPVNGLEMSSI